MRNRFLSTRARTGLTYGSNAAWALVTLLILAASLLHAPAVSAQPHDLVIHGVTLVDGTGGPARPGVAVYVRDGRISAIADGAGLEATARVDGRGKYLIPGLFDAHAHPFPFEDSFPQFVHHGVTSILITGCSDCSAANLARARDMSAAGEVPSPRVFHTSQHFTMQGRHPVKTYPDGNWVEGETVFFVSQKSDVAALVEKAARQPIVGLKVTIEDGPKPPLVEMIPVDLVREIVDQAHARDLPVLAHVSTMKGLRVAEAAGVDHLVHFVGIDVDWEEDAAVIERLRARDPGWVTTLMVDKGLLYPLHPEWLAEVEASGLYDGGEIERLRETRTAERSRNVLRRLYGVEEPTLETVIGPQVDDLRELHRRGFSLVVGTDTSNAFIFPGVSVHEEMELLALRFQPAEILPMATRNAARLVGALDDLGTLEVGKRADMVLLDRDPLADIRNTRSIAAVFRDGVRQSRLGDGGDGGDGAEEDDGGSPEPAPEAGEPSRGSPQGGSRNW